MKFKKYIVLFIILFIYLSLISEVSGVPYTFYDDSYEGIPEENKSVIKITINDLSSYNLQPNRTYFEWSLDRSLWNSTLMVFQAQINASSWRYEAEITFIDLTKNYMWYKYVAEYLGANYSSNEKLQGNIPINTFQPDWRMAVYMSLGSLVLIVYPVYFITKKICNRKKS